MNTEVFITGQSVPAEKVEGHTVVVIDVLRACSTIVTAMCNGARNVVPVPDMNQARRIASNLEKVGYLLGGERGGFRIEGYHCGNSPLEYTRERVQGRMIILSTTNGTVAMHKGQDAKNLLIGCFLNIDRIVEAIRELGNDLTIICAGQKNRVSLEDTLCAGYILDRLWDREPAEGVSDAALIAFSLYDRNRMHLEATLRQGRHARWLASKGFEDDVDYCFQFNSLPVLPYYRENRVVLDKTGTSLDAV